MMTDRKEKVALLTSPRTVEPTQEAVEKLGEKALETEEESIFSGSLLPQELFSDVIKAHSCVAWKLGQAASYL